ncbi:MAG: hypothetical protein ACXVCO_01220 [Ktedonobacterales bacterium]
MGIVTTYVGTRPAKSFSWSYSRLKNYEACPKKHFEVDLQRNFKEEESEALLHGNITHDQAAKRIAKNIPLPAGQDFLEGWCQKIVGDGSVPILTEQKLAITKEFAPCEWFAKNAWYRGVADVAKITGPVALAVDWKTGKILEDSVQLGLMAACLFAHHPDVQVIRTHFVWLKDEADSRQDFKRSEMPKFWRDLWPRIDSLENAFITTTYPAKSSGLCKRHCPVLSCGFHGGSR